MHCVKSVQIRNFFWCECEKIYTRKNSVFGRFSRSDGHNISFKHFKNFLLNLTAVKAFITNQSLRFNHGLNAVYLYMSNFYMTAFSNFILLKMKSSMKFVFPKVEVNPLQIYSVPGNTGLFRNFLLFAG